MRDAARMRHDARRDRLARNERIANRKAVAPSSEKPSDQERRQAAVAAALARARARRAAGTASCVASSVAALALSASIAMAQPTTDFSAQLDKLWNFGKPEESKARFRAELAKHPADSREALEIQTQIARTQSLARKFAEADKTLDAVLPRGSSRRPYA